MFVALAIAAAASAEPNLTALSLGSSKEISQAIVKISALTQKADFAGAKEALALLPNPNLKLQWKDSAAPEGSRYDYARERDQALKAWGVDCPAIRAQIVADHPDMVVVFDQGSGLRLSWSENLGQPRLTASIGLKEGGQPILPSAVFNEFAYALGSYYGIAKLPMPGILMSGPSPIGTQELRLLPIETGIANANLSLGNQIRSDVENKRAVVVGLPSISGAFAPVKLGPVLQGGKLPMQFDVTNNGKGVLAFRLVPDCGCMSAERVRNVGAGQTVTAHAQMDTAQFTGPVHHTLYLLSNDPDDPIKPIPVDVAITPRYRMLPERQSTVSDDNGNATVTAYLYTPPGHPLNVLGAESQGVDAAVSYEPWSGEMADPALDEGPAPRKGYKFTARFKNIPEGIQLGTTLIISTDDPQFAEIPYPIQIQRGIIALPPSVFMGEIGAAPRRMTFLLTRPGKPFKVLSIDTDSSHIKASYAPSDGGSEYRITVDYDGKASRGDYHATVTAKTDDPKQDTIRIPVMATVRK